MQNVAYNLIIGGEEWTIESTPSGWSAYCHETEDTVSAPETFSAEQFEYAIRLYCSGIKAGEKLGRYHQRKETSAVLRKLLDL